MTRKFRSIVNFACQYARFTRVWFYLLNETPLDREGLISLSWQ
jgi:hypothetical protein